MSESTRIVRDATCTFCGCVCDDMHLTVDDATHRITKAENACVLGRAWFKEHGIEERPFALVGGREASTAEAIEEAAQILAKARFPVDLRALRHHLRGAAAGSGDRRHDRRQRGYHHVGVPRSVRHRVPGHRRKHGNPRRDPQPRRPAGVLGRQSGRVPPAALFTRYAVTAKGMYVPNGRKDRTVVLVDVRRTPSAAVADIFVQVKPQRDFEVLWALRALVRGRRVDPGIEKVTGVPLATLEDLASRMKRCRYGVLFFGMGLTMTRGRHFNSRRAARARDRSQRAHPLRRQAGARARQRHRRGQRGVVADRVSRSAST